MKTPFWPIILAAGGLASCGGETCAPAAMPGHYVLRGIPDHYEIHLAGDGSGTVSHNREPAVPTTWTWESVSAQVFLDVSGKTAARWTAIDDPRRPQPDLASFNRSYYGLTPTCRSGAAKRLSIGIEERVFFTRVD